MTFEALIKAILNEGTVESQLAQLCRDRTVKITTSMGNSNENTAAVTRNIASQGKQVGQTWIKGFSGAVTRAPKLKSVPNIEEFAKQQLQREKTIIDNANKIYQNNSGSISKSQSLRISNQFQNDTERIARQNGSVIKKSFQETKTAYDRAAKDFYSTKSKYDTAISKGNNVEAANFYKTMQAQKTALANERKNLSQFLNTDDLNNYVRERQRILNQPYVDNQDKLAQNAVNANQKTQGQRVVRMRVNQAEAAKAEMKYNADWDAAIKENNDRSAKSAAQRKSAYSGIIKDQEALLKQIDTHQAKMIKYMNDESMYKYHETQYDKALSGYNKNSGVLKVRYSDLYTNEEQTRLDTQLTNGEKTRLEYAKQISAENAKNAKFQEQQAQQIDLINNKVKNGEYSKVVTNANAKIGKTDYTGNEYYDKAKADVERLNRLQTILSSGKGSAGNRILLAQEFDETSKRFNNNITSMGNTVDKNQPKISQFQDKFSDSIDLYKDLNKSKNSSRLGSYGSELVSSKLKEAEKIQETIQGYVDANDYTNANKYLKDHVKVIHSASEAYDLYSGSVDAFDKQSKIFKAQQWAKENTKAIRAGSIEWNNLMNQYSGDLTIGQQEDIERKIKKFQLGAAERGLLGKSFFGDLKEKAVKFTSWFGISQAIQMGIQSVKQMEVAVREVDSSMTDLYKVTDNTQSEYDQFYKSAQKSAIELGRTTSSYIDQTANWAKLGYSLKDSAKLSKLSSIYSNVGEVNDDTAVSDMVTAMKAFNLDTNDAEHIIDSFNKLGNEFAVSAADLGEGLSKSASSLNTAGVDLNEALAMIAGGSEITQDAGSFGNFLKTSVMRIRGMKGALEELGEEVDDSVDSISKVQTQILNLTNGKINIFDSNGDFRDYYEIIKDISEIHGQLSSQNAAALDEILFGKNRANQGMALIQAFQSGQVDKALQAALNSEGSAQAEQDRWMNSLEARTQQFKASFQNLSTSLINSDIFGSMITGASSFLSILTSIVDKLPLLSSLIGGIAGIKLTKNSLGKQTIVVKNALFYKIA